MSAYSTKTFNVYQATVPEHLNQGSANGYYLTFSKKQALKQASENALIERSPVETINITIDSQLVGKASMQSTPFLDAFLFSTFRDQTIFNRVFETIEDLQEFVESLDGGFTPHTQVENPTVNFKQGLKALLN